MDDVSDRTAGQAAHLHVRHGDALPLGPHECHAGVNLAVFSRHATGMNLLVFDRSRALLRTIGLDRRDQRSGDIWHCRLIGDPEGLLYAWQAEGADDPSRGDRFDAGIPLLDPYAAIVVGGQAWDRPDPMPARCGFSTRHFDWQGSESPRHPWSGTVIYETHVRGLTVHESSAVAHRGKYRGVVEKIPYLKELGITAIELLPVQAFHPDAIGGRQDPHGRRLRDYWGYNPIAFFAPMAGYASEERAEAALLEFKEMVRELHKAGIEVILDVVFNHTGEGGDGGPTYSFRGLDNRIYYLLRPDGRYADFTGCGNTLNCNHPVVRTLIVDCLRHWVTAMRVDGFRFDLASVLGRDAHGNLLSNPPLLEQIAEDPILRGVKLIAEAWDAGGAFQVGSFPGTRWAEWNSRYRDDVRRFWRGDPGMSGRFATRLCGSADLYERNGQSPVNSINYVTCHDGFTLSDLVSYAMKHNEANGEDNLDGAVESYGENNGVEGASDDSAVEMVRARQVRNLLATLLLSRGVPMLLGGDEFRRTQGGNNNAYCQDNEVSWYDWTLAMQHAGLVRFVRKLIDLRRRHPVLSAERFYTAGEIAWLGPRGAGPSWDGPENRLGCVVSDPSGTLLCMLFNAAREPCVFAVPQTPVGAWHLIVDTARQSPEDASDHPLQVPAGSFGVEARSMVVLETARQEDHH